MAISCCQFHRLGSLSLNLLRSARSTMEAAHEDAKTHKPDSGFLVSEPFGLVTSSASTPVATHDTTLFEATCVSLSCLCWTSKVLPQQHAYAIPTVCSHASRNQDAQLHDRRVLSCETRLSHGSIADMLPNENLLPDLSTQNTHHSRARMRSLQNLA